VYILFLPKRTVYQNCFAIWYSCPSLKLNTRILLTNTRLQRKAEYESQLKSLHSKIQHMESEAHKHQAQLMQHQLRANQIASLQQSLLDAKTQVLFVTCNFFVCLFDLVFTILIKVAHRTSHCPYTHCRYTHCVYEDVHDIMSVFLFSQRKQLMESSKAELERQRELQATHQKEIAKLKDLSRKTDKQVSHWKSLAEQRNVIVFSDAHLTFEQFSCFLTYSLSAILTMSYIYLLSVYISPGYC
jgi:DNA repair exonuclease SbcCD ATPase subunit